LIPSSVNHEERWIAKALDYLDVDADDGLLERSRIGDEGAIYSFPGDQNYIERTIKNWVRALLIEVTTATERRQIVFSSIQPPSRTGTPFSQNTVSALVQAGCTHIFWTSEENFDRDYASGTGFEDAQDVHHAIGIYHCPCTETEEGPRPFELPQSTESVAFNAFGPCLLGVGRRATVDDGSSDDGTPETNGGGGGSSGDSGAPDGLGGGAIAGIVVGSVAGVAAVAAVVVGINSGWFAAPKVPKITRWYLPQERAAWWRPRADYERLGAL